jgi:hypothetical protein
LNEVKSGAAIQNWTAAPGFRCAQSGYVFDRSCKNRILANLCGSDRFSVAVALFVEAVAIQCFTATKPLLQ